MKNLRPILLVEDDSIDVMQVKRALKEKNMSNPVISPEDGQQALEYLESNSNDKPCLVLLDLNMPGLDGLEFLKKIKNNEEYKKIPVVVFTSSENEDDVQECFNLGAAGYIVKPEDYRRFMEIFEVIDNYWTLNKSPNGI